MDENMITNRIRFNNHGLSLIEVMVAMAISALVSLGVMRINQNSQKSMNKIVSDAELQDFKSYLKDVFSDYRNCVNTYRDINQDATFDFFSMNDDASLAAITPVVPHSSYGVTARRYYSYGPGLNTSYNIPVQNDDTLNEGMVDLSIATTPTYHRNMGTAANLVVKSNLLLERDKPIPNVPSWIFKEIRFYLPKIFSNGVAADDICAIEIKVERAGGAPRSYGPIEKSVHVILNCSWHSNGEMAYCVNYESIQTSPWKWIDKSDPTKGVQFKYPVKLK